MINKINTKLYEEFHKESRIQKKIIGSNNFTYINVISELHKSIPINKKTTIFDFGCGVGTLAMYLSKFGKKIIAADISKKAIYSAKISSKNMNINNVDFFLFGTRKLPEDIDLVTCIEVIEHVPRPNQTMNSIFKCLNKGGYLFLTTPTDQAPLYKLGLLGGFDKRVGHVRRYSDYSLRRLISETGFELVSINKKEGILRNILYTLQPFGWMIRFIRGPIATAFTFIDDISAKMFGGSNYFVVARKP